MADKGQNDKSARGQRTGIHRATSCGSTSCRTLSNGTASIPHLLVVDDEVAIADLVVTILEEEGMRATAFYDPLSALQAFDEDVYDLAILDIMMPQMDGYELFARMRAKKDIPVVFLSAKDGEADIVIGLTLGAEDYVTKPFKPRELIARVKARLRRAMRAPGSMDNLDRLSSSVGIEVDKRSHQATLHDVPLSLTPKEFDILALLLEKKGQPVSAKELYESAWQEEANASSANTVMVHVRHLRRKLAEIDSSQAFIETAWGVGYKILA